MVFGKNKSEKKENAKGQREEMSVESLRERARALSILGLDRMNRDELLYEISKAEGGDGSLGV